MYIENLRDSWEKPSFFSNFHLTSSVLKLISFLCLFKMLNCLSWHCNKDYLFTCLFIYFFYLTATHQKNTSKIRSSFQKKNNGITRGCSVHKVSISNPGKISITMKFILMKKIILTHFFRKPKKCFMIFFAFYFVPQLNLK